MLTVRSANLVRRHLDESQRAMIAAKVATLKQGRPDQDSKQGNSPVSLADASRLLNVNASSIQAARVVREQATPELVQAVERGLERNR
jgi:hypothetical protein